MDSNYGRGGVTSNEDVLRNFCTNSSEVKANNLSTHYDSSNDEVLLRQYGVLIATRKGDKLMITSKRYSVTTSKVQNELLRIAMEYGLDVQKTNEFAKGGKVKSLNDGLEVYAENDLQLKVIQDIIPILDKKGIKLRFAVKVGKFPQSIIFDNHYRDSALVIPGKGYESEYLPVWYDNEFQDANEFENLETNPAPYLPNLDDRDEYAQGGEIESLNGYFQAYHSGPMAGKKDEGYVAIQDEYDLEKYITNKLGNVVKKVVLIEKEKDYPYNPSNPYFHDIYDVELKDGRKFQVVRSYGRPNWAGNVSYKEQIQVKYAKGGNVENHKLSTSLKSKLKSANNILKRYGGREITEQEATMWNVYHNATSGFEAGYEAFDVAGANNYHNATTREHETIGDNLIDISRAMIGVDYDDYNFRGTKEENENYYIMNYKNKKFSEGGDIAQGNYEMMLSQAKEVEHHVEELQNILKGEKDIDAWVVAKMENVSSTLSDITHYLDGKTEYAHGGKMSRGNEEGSIEIYYQPQLTDKEWQSGLINSWEVFKSKKLAEKVFRGKKILEYKGDDIEEKTYVDNDFEYAHGGEMHGEKKSYETLFKEIVDSLEKDYQVDREKAYKFVYKLDRWDKNKELLEDYSPEQVANMYVDEMEDEDNEYAKGGQTKGVEWVVNFISEVDRGDYVTKYVIAKSESEAVDKGYMEISDDGEESDDYQLSSVYKLSSVKMATKKVKDGQSAPQTDRWIFAYKKGGYNYYTQKEVPYKKVVDANKKGAPVGYRFSKFAEEKGLTNNRFRKPTKSEVEQYAGKKKNGKLIMYRETRSNKSDVNPKKKI